MIMSWLSNTMMPKINGSYIFLSIAQEVWDTMKQMYSKLKNVSLICEIKINISTTKQGHLHVIEDFDAMKVFLG